MIAIIIALTLAIIIGFIVYLFVKKKRASISSSFISSLNPFARFILLCLMGISLIALIGIILSSQTDAFSKSITHSAYIKVAAALALLNGLIWGALNASRSQNRLSWKIMALSSITITCLLIIPFIPTLLFVLAVISTATLIIWPFFAGFLIVLFFLYKNGKLSKILGAIFRSSQENIDNILLRHKRAIIFVSIFLLAAPFVIIILFYLMLFLGISPDVGPMGH